MFPAELFDANNSNIFVAVELASTGTTEKTRVPIG